MFRLQAFFSCSIVLIVLLYSCAPTIKTISADNAAAVNKNLPAVNSKAKTFIKPLDVDREAFVKYAKSLLGTKYLYGSTNADKGLDCSGFVYNVFQHFDVRSPRVTKDYTNEGKEVSRKQVRVGDLILFTGSDHSSGVVGHMGIITQTSPYIMFVHSASGKNVGVILNKLEGYYEKHFVKMISVLK